MINYKVKIKQNKGITLIALVITIIVLLILAAVSIATLTGENGILTRASDAKNTMNEKGALETVQMEVAGSFDETGNYSSDLAKTNLENNLGATVTDKGNGALKVEYKGYEFNIDIEGNTSQVVTIVDTGETAPYLPAGATVTNSDLSTGVTIKDANKNEWTWIEVPKLVTADKTTDSDIEAALVTYAATVVTNRGSYSDTWYDGNGKTKADGGDVNDATGCGLTESEYNTKKSQMLQSIKANGGFYIGKYEVGIENTYRTAKGIPTETPVIKQDAYPYNYVTCSQAEGLAESLATGGKTSSLMFGIQWDLVLKYLNVKTAKRVDELTSNSTNWGNYSNKALPITSSNAKQSTDYGGTYTTITGTKPANNGIILTTGASNDTGILNIYDLAGNMWEWTLEKTSNSDGPCASRGGYCDTSGSIRPASIRSYCYTTLSSFGNAFRPSLY